VTFLPSALTDSTNRYVTNQPADRNPVFKRPDTSGTVHFGGSVLRYSSTTPIPPMIPIPGGFRTQRTAQKGA
jgi:hypothetical protein